MSGSSIREVARLSGVSVATVSRVLNGSTKVRAETRERVLARARELDYVPSAAARTLARRRSQLLGVVLFTGDEHPDLGHPFFQDVLVGLKHAVGARDYDVLLFAGEPRGPDGSRSYLRRALHHHVDGVVVLAPNRHDAAAAELRHSPLPTVTVDLDETGPSSGYVTSDNLAGGRLAVEHLRARGHERIATIAGPRDSLAGEARLAGYRAALRRAGLRARRGYVVEGDYYGESGYEGMRRLLALPEPPTAVFAAADLMAIGAIQAARDAGLDVPGDLAVVGFDDVAVAAHVGLTTVRQDRAALGTAAGEALVAMIESPEEPPPAIVLPVELVVRGSS